mmetsp:Transcript_28906/g.33387  ORF Transcript_28906/g.33387 Transcript_28906/m.33387 type:complete len:80 (-) Transcript_28906:532-771(-)
MWRVLRDWSFENGKETVSVESEEHHHVLEERMMAIERLYYGCHHELVEPMGPNVEATKLEFQHLHHQRANALLDGRRRT